MNEKKEKPEAELNEMLVAKQTGCRIMRIHSEEKVVSREKEEYKLLEVKDAGQWER